MIEFFLKRPIFAAVCAIVIVLAGAVVIPTLPVAQFPQVAPPVVTVASTYTGANAASVEATVTTPLEEAINGVEGLRYMSSTSNNDGTSSITCTFELDRSLDIATTDVQNAVNNTLGRLPGAVRNSGVSVTKNSGQFLMGIGFSSTNTAYDQLFLSNYVDLNVRDTIKRVKGVSDARIFGERRYAMRLWLDPKKLADHGLAAEDVTAALTSQNIDVAAGTIGAPPQDTSQPYELNVRAIGRLARPEQFGRLILKTLPDGGHVRLSDVGRSELGAENYAQAFRLDGNTAVGVAVLILPSANAVQVSHDVLATLDQLAPKFPRGVKYKVGFDGSDFVRDSIGEVIKTLALSIVLVIIVIFLFLQDWKTTLIPAVTIPVSLIGTFALMKALGFSINTLTMFGLTLATGLVVDDAIVVLENIARYVHDRKMSPFEGASAAMREIVGAVVASSIVLLAVFIPVTFFQGSTGLLYKQFALTIVCSITISLFTSLTLTPPLSALLLAHEEKPAGGFWRLVNRAIDGTRHAYQRLLPLLFTYRKAVIGLFVVSLLAVAVAYTAIPTGFLPDEDQGYYFVTVQGPEGSTLSHTVGVVQRLEAIVRETPEVSALFEPVGFGFTGTGTNRALMFVRLLPWSERRRDDQSVAAILNVLRGKFAHIADAKVFVFNPPAIRGIGNFAGFQFELQDGANAGLSNLTQTGSSLIASANASPVLRAVNTTFRNDNPQLVIDFDRDKATSLGVPIGTVFTAMQIYLGSQYVNDFSFLNRSYRVYVQADTANRAVLDSLQQVYVKSAGGGNIPLTSLIRMHVEKTAPIINHYNLFRSIEINGVPAQGYGSGQALAAMARVAAAGLPAGFRYEWSGISLEQIQFGSQAVFIFALGIVFVFLTLAAKYESWTDPLIILFSVPLALLGAILALDLRGLVSDLYAQVGFLMLIALASKNAILIVEFANQLRAQGRDEVSAVREAAQIRLRPILMTSLAFIFAITPLVFASGAGSASRHSLGTAVFGGMILSSILNLVFIPVFYVLVVRTRERLRPGTTPRALAGAGAGGNGATHAQLDPQPETTGSGS